MLGRKDPPHFTGDLAYRITVKASDMRMHPGLVELAENPAINMWMGPQAHAVCYLLKGGDLYNIVLVCPDNLPEFINTAKADLQEMRDFFANWDPKLRALLDMVQETSKWRLQSSQEMYTWCHEGGKFALLGDACHATLPYM
jgi:salicylate hydroxylase